MAIGIDQHSGANGHRNFQTFSNGSAHQTRSKKPNFLVIVADDLGFSDLSCYGSEIQTPNLDQLASEGSRLLNFHTSSACSPTRAMLLTGTDAHLAGMGTMLEYKSSEMGTKRWGGKPGHEGFLNKEVATISEILHDDGYYSVISGKWHLGLRVDHGPQDRGFDRSFSLLPGCCNHYGWEPLLQDGRSALPMAGRPLHTENGMRADVRPNVNEDPEGFYSTRTYTERFIDFLENRALEDEDKPFFGYLAYSAPHFPIQAPKTYIDKYKGMYDEGPEVLRQDRLKRLKEMRIISEDTKAHDPVMVGVTEWDAMSEYQRRCSSRCMETYAAMVTYMDEYIGKVVNYLKVKGEYENTTIIFMSDNGAEGAALEAAPVLGPQITKVLKQYYDNSPENIGAYNSFTWIGPQWAQASTAPSRLYKCFPSEGGILVPCIVKCPRFLPDHQQGAFSRAFTTCMDIAPTFLDMLGLPSRYRKDGSKILHGNRKVHSMRGESWLPYYGRNSLAEPDATEEAAVHSSQSVHGWELFARAALRKGDWKIVHIPKAYGGNADGDDGWELFNIREDPGEIQNLAQYMPEKMQEMLEGWATYVAESGVIWGPGAMEPGLAKELAPLLYDNAMEHTCSWMETPVGSQPVIHGVAHDAKHGTGLSVL